MQLSTKKCILTYSGAVMFAFGFTLISVGKDYFNLPYSASASYDPPKVVRAIPHWCGVLLILLGARNFTFGLAQWKYGMNCCGTTTVIMHGQPVMTHQAPPGVVVVSGQPQQQHMVVQQQQQYGHVQMQTVYGQQQPPPAYGQPAPAYGQPAPAYGQPAPAYGQPAFTAPGQPMQQPYGSAPPMTVDEVKH